MNRYPKVLSYRDWLGKYIFVLPENTILKVLYFPFCLAGGLFCILTMGLLIM